MRKYFFKGKRVSDNSWTVGSYYADGEKHYIITPKDGFVEVDPNTVCQYIGFRDRCGNYIFEHDIIELINRHYYTDSLGNRKIFSTWEKAEVTVREGVLRGQNYKNSFLYPHFAKGSRDITVVGNIFDNPELIKEVFPDFLDKNKEEGIISSSSL